MSPKWQECIRMWYHYSKSSLLLNLKVLKTSWKLTHKNLSFFSSLLFSIFTCCIILSFAFRLLGKSFSYVLFQKTTQAQNVRQVTGCVQLSQRSATVPLYPTSQLQVMVCGSRTSCRVVVFQVAVTNLLPQNLLKICWKFVENHDFHIAHIFTLKPFGHCVIGRFLWTPFDLRDTGDDSEPHPNLPLAPRT